MKSFIRGAFTNNSKILKLIAYFILEIIGFFIIFSIIKSAGYDKILQIFKTARLHNIFYGLLMYFLAMNVRAFKWKILFNASNYKLPNIFLHYFMIASLGVFIPLKTGDLVLPFLKKNRSKKGSLNNYAG